MQDLGSLYGMNVFPFYPEREGGVKGKSKTKVRCASK